MKATFIMIVIVSCFIVSSCKSQLMNQTTYPEDIVYIISQEKLGLKEANLILNDTILESISIGGPENWSSLINKNQFALIRNFNINEPEDIVNFQLLFSDNDLRFMKLQASENTYPLWSSIITTHFVSNNTSHFVSYSIPVFNEEGNFAIVYVEDSYSGSLKVFKKEIDKWVYFANGLVWIE